MNRTFICISLFVIVTGTNGLLFSPADQYNKPSENQDLNVSLTSEEANIENPGILTKLEVQTRYDSIIVSMAGVSNETLANMLNGTVSSEGVLVPVPRNGSIPIHATPNFVCESGTGNYTLRVRNNREGANSIQNISFTAVRDGDVDIVLLNTFTSIQHGNSTNITLKYDEGEIPCWESRDLLLQINSSSSDLTIQTELKSPGNDNMMHIKISTGVEAVNSANVLITGINNTTIANSSLSGSNVSTPLPPGEYVVRIYDQDMTELTTGLVTVVPVEDGSPATTESSPTIDSSVETTETTEDTTTSSQNQVTSTTGPGLSVFLTGIIVFLSVAFIFGNNV
jgi:hypothetical protein